MIADPRMELTKRLLDKSASGFLEWQLSPDKNTFVVALGEFLVSLSEHDDPEYPEAPDYRIIVRHSDAVVIDSFGNATLCDMSRGFFGQERNVYGAMNDIYEAARRNALGVDKGDGSLTRPSEVAP